jgi:hypothetical protein
VSRARVHVSFGALAPTIDEQLREQDFKLDMDPTQRARLQSHVDSVTDLRIHSILTEGESDKARKRIMKIITKHVRPL